MPNGEARPTVPGDLLSSPDTADLGADPMAFLLERARARTRCGCWRLAYPLIDDTLPDHICPETMRDSVKSWALDEWISLEPTLRAFLEHKPERPPRIRPRSHHCSPSSPRA